MTMGWSGSRLRAAIAGLAAIWTLLTLGLAWREPWATWIWPWSDVLMTYIFLASIAAAVAAPLAWIAWRDEPAALAGISIDGAAIGGLMTPALLIMGINRDDSSLLVYGIGAGISTAVAWLVFRRWHPLPPRHTQPLPVPVRFAFGVYVVGLLAVGGALLLRTDGVFPWDLPSATSTMIGAMFMGAATYFAYGLWRNCWAHGGGQLAGFLAYDVVLAIPYLRMIGDDDSGGGMYGSYGGRDEVNDSSLTVYLTVIAVSAAISIYYLAIHRPTRVWGRAH
jgi:hypothetical protein